MTVGRLGILAGILLSAPFIATVATRSADRIEPIELAQAPPPGKGEPPLTEEERKSRERERQKEKGPPPAPKGPPPPAKAPPPLPKAIPQPPAKASPPAAKEVSPPPEKGPPPGKRQPPPPEKGTPSPERKSLSPPGPPPAAKSVPSDLPKGVGPVPEDKKDIPKRVAPGQPLPPDKGPTALPKGGPAAPQVQGPRPPAIIGTPPTRPDRASRAAEPAPRFDELQKGRTQRTEEGGKRTVIQEPGPGNRIIVKQDNRSIILHDESERFRRLHRDARSERRPDGNTETFYVRPDGVRVVTVVDPYGRLVRRYRRDRDGREFSIIDNRRFLRNAGIAVGVGAIGLAVALNLPPPRVRIPREQYIVEYDRASDDDLYEALSAAPIEELERSYSLEEVRFNYELRQRMRRVDLDTIIFEFGSWQVGENQFPKLERVASVMRRLLERNPDEVFLVAAYTDAVGSDVDNLSLSDRRAEAVAQILSEEFGIPAENLVTQGYGEQYLKIETQGPEPRNRRVEVQRITPLIAER
jgi:outer membrane protein OmpA-like peptidoglycan-associated protein